MIAENSKHMSIEGIAGNLFIFFLAGQETTGGTSAFTLFELAQHPDKMKKAQEEVLSVLAKYNGEVDYDALKEMTYLELCMQGKIQSIPLKNL